MSRRPLKIAIVVHGRFHAFHLAAALIKKGQNVTLFTNYPKSVAEKFGIPRERVRSFLFHGILSRLLLYLAGPKSFEPLLNRLFSRWAAKRLSCEAWDVTHYFSGIAYDCLRAPVKSRISLVMRGSAHILAQDKLLEEEGRRVRASVERPSRWMIEREMKEYGLADRIVVLSSFARNSFIAEGVEPGKVWMLPLGVDIKRFSADNRVIEERRARFLSGKPIRVLMTGNFSYQKGVIDFVEIATALRGRFEFRFVGNVPPEMKEWASGRDLGIEFVQKQPEFELPAFYHWADLFVFTTIQDGFAVVLCQAQASGLPILATANCSAPDLIKGGENGWVFPVRKPREFIERLEWCDEHRKEMAEMTDAVYRNFKSRDWGEVADDFIRLCSEHIAQKSGC